MDLRFEVLGPMRVLRGDQEVRVTGRRQRLLLSILLAEAPRIVATARLIDALWDGDAEPQDPVNALHQYVAHIRRALSQRPRSAAVDPLETSPPGYRLVLPVGALDTADLAALAARIADLQQRDDHAGAVQVAYRAEALWRGVPFAEFADHPFLRPFVDACTERRLVVLERLMTSLSALGEYAKSLEVLETGIPWADRPELAAAYVAALAFTDRQADALAAAEEHRRRLADRGLEPTVAFRRLTDEIASLGRPRVDHGRLVVVRSATAASLRTLLVHLPEQHVLDLSVDQGLDYEIAAADAANDPEVSGDTELWLATMRRRETGVLDLLGSGDTRDGRDVSRMLSLAVAYARFWDWTGDQARLRRELEAALDASLRGGWGDDRTIAEAAGWLAYSYDEDPRRSERYLDLARQRTACDPLGAGRALAVESVVVRRSAPETALDRGAAAVRLLVHHGTPVEAAYAHVVSALAAIDAQLPHAAAWHAQEADSLYRHVGDLRGLAWVDVIQSRLDGHGPSFAPRFSAEHDERTVAAMLDRTDDP